MKATRGKGILKSMHRKSFNGQISTEKLIMSHVRVKHVSLNYCLYIKKSMFVTRRQSDHFNIYLQTFVIMQVSSF